MCTCPRYVSLCRGQCTHGLTSLALACSRSLVKGFASIQCAYSNPHEKNSVHLTIMYCPCLLIQLHVVTTKQLSEAYIVPYLSMGIPCNQFWEAKTFYFLLVSCLLMLNSSHRLGDSFNLQLMPCITWLQTLL